MFTFSGRVSRLPILYCSFRFIYKTSFQICQKKEEKDLVYALGAFL